MDEEHRAEAERLWAEADRRARERGVTEPELSEKRRQFFELLEQQGGDAAVDRLEREWPRIVTRGPSGRPTDVGQLLGLPRSPVLWLAEHRLVFCALLVALAGILGYFGALGRMGRQPVGSGIPGLLYGVGGPSRSSLS